LAYLDPKINAFDALFLIDILEHLDKDQLLKLLEKVNISLRFGGIVVIHVPNGEGIFGGKARYSDLTHEISFTAQSINQVLTACGFTNIRCFEDRPTIHGLPSFVRYVLWQLFTLPYRILMLAETGVGKCVLSQNMLVIAEKNN